MLVALAMLVASHVKAVFIPFSAVTSVTGGVAQLLVGGGGVTAYQIGDVTFGIPTVATGHGHWYMAVRMRLVVMGGFSEVLIQQFAVGAGGSAMWW